MYSALLKETLYYSISKVIPGLFGLISIILFIRIVGQDIYGQYSLLLSQCNLIVALGFGWLNQAKLRYYTIDCINKKYFNYQKKAFSYCLIFSFFVLSTLVFYQSLSYKVWLVSFIIILGMSCFNYLKTFYQAKLLPDMIILFTSIQSVIAIIAPIAIMYFFGYNEISLLLGIGLSFFIAIIILFKTEIISILFKKNQSMIQEKNLIIKKWFSYGAPLSLWFAVGLALSFLDRFYINYFLTSEELGAYTSLQELLTRSFSLTLFPFTMALHPRIMKLWNTSKLQDVAKLIIRSILMIFSIGIFIILIAWLYRDLIFSGIQKIIPTINFKAKFLIFPLFAAGFLWQLSLVTHKMLELKEQTNLMIVAILPSLIINIIGNTYFLPTMGGIATAYTAFFSALVYFIITSIHCIHSLIRIKTI